MFDKLRTLVDQAESILVIQAENPDADSVGSSLALEEILGDLGKRVTLYCAIDLPKYLRYIQGWDRVVDEFPHDFDLAIIVDTASKILLDKALTPENTAQLAKHPLVILDHHVTEGDLELTAEAIVDTTVVSTGELIHKIATQAQWPINPRAAEHLVISIMGDSLGLTTEATSARTVHTVADLIEKGAHLYEVENRRREFNKKSRDILAYKATLLGRIEYYNDDALALIHIPWEEIAAYSDKYNPSMLVLDEMRLVEGVRVAIALKTYPDGKITAKIRSNSDAPISEKIAAHFGGGGHTYAAGFRIYDDDYDKVRRELISAVDTILRELSQKS